MQLGSSFLHGQLDTGDLRVIQLHARACASASWFSKTLFLRPPKLELALEVRREELAGAILVRSWRLSALAYFASLTVASDCLAPFMTTTFSPPIEVAARLSLGRGATSQSNWASLVRGCQLPGAIDHAGLQAVTTGYVRLPGVVRENGLGHGVIDQATQVGQSGCTRGGVILQVTAGLPHEGQNLKVVVRTRTRSRCPSHHPLGCLLCDLLEGCAQSVGTTTPRILEHLFLL